MQTASGGCHCDNKWVEFTLPRNLVQHRDLDLFRRAFRHVLVPSRCPTAVTFSMIEALKVPALTGRENWEAGANPALPPQRSE